MIVNSVYYQCVQFLIIDPVPDKIPMVFCRCCRQATVDDLYHPLMKFVIKNLFKIKWIRLIAFNISAAMSSRPSYTDHPYWRHFFCSIFSVPRLKTMLGKKSAIISISRIDFAQAKKYDQ